jgi:Fic family protein
MINNYIVSSKIFNLITSISIKIGEIKANHLEYQSKPFFIKNRINCIYNTLLLDGGKLSHKQVEGIVNNKKIGGFEKDVKEVANSIKVYDKLSKINYLSEKRFSLVHSELSSGTSIHSGSYRKGDAAVSIQMNELFSYLKNSDDPIFLKSCVAHYQIQKIKPFENGNGQIARLWQRLILLSEFPVFEFLPFENVLVNSQKIYKALLSKNDLTSFIEYQLGILDVSLQQILNYNNRILKDIDRIEYFSSICKSEFTRKDYMNIFKDLSTASASRDLKKAVDLGLFSVIGDKNRSKYRVTKHNYLKLS